MHLYDSVSHDFPLFHVTIGREHRNRFTRILFREYLFPDLLTVLGNQTVGSLHDGLRRTVILFQLEQARILIRLRKVQYIVNIRSAEGVNALRIISHHTDTLVLLRQLPHDTVLYKVGILILINQHIVELRGIAFTNLRMLLEQQISIYQQVIEVHYSPLPAAFPVTQINIPYGRHLGSTVTLKNFRISRIGLRQYQMILRIADSTQYSPRLIRLVIQLHFLDDCLYQTFRIIRIVNGKMSRKTDSLSLGTQNP